MVMNFMIKWLAIVTLLRALLYTVTYANASSHGVTVSCMLGYEEGGAPAVFNSPHCSQLVFSAESSNSTKNCQFAMLQGRREYQEDRVACNLGLKLPFSGEGGPEETTVGVAAIFDGHGGDEASEMASEMLLDYFLIHVEFTAYKRVLPNYQENNKSHSSHQSTPVVIDRLSLRSILEEALLRTIQDIDSEFSNVALDKGYVSGSTGTIVLLYNGQLLVANVGDSKALLCSKKGDSSKEVYVDELTRDHHPDREDEKARIKAAGGFITREDVPRVNGILAMSRAIGDIYLKRYGVTAEAEITGWRTFTTENSYLVVASDGVFETLTPKNVCDLLHDKASELSPCSASSLPERIIHRAFKTGSRDNLSAIVISDLRHASNVV
ncbi:hypothetical protein C2S52_023109 [Perilla frutescens var. hirtella]|nr:hypothetical protein C2S52_023109 [Perilla frutescens var. hirtella]